MIWALLLAAASLEGVDETPWVEGETFADAKACAAHLGALAEGLRQAGEHEIVRGPYEIADGDLRFHAVTPEGSGHRIAEYRCLDAALSSRTWTHEMEQQEEKSWLESVAERLNKGAAEQ